jgi:hypothetical protein
MPAIFMREQRGSLIDRALFWTLVNNGHQQF